MSDRTPPLLLTLYVMDVSMELDDRSERSPSCPNNSTQQVAGQRMVQRLVLVKLGDEPSCPYSRVKFDVEAMDRRSS